LIVLQRAVIASCIDDLALKKYNHFTCVTQISSPVILHESRLSPPYCHEADNQTGHDSRTKLKPGTMAMIVSFERPAEDVIPSSEYCWVYYLQFASQ
jgi:hypothetical protein